MAPRATMDISIGRGSLLIDTGAFIALADARDGLHRQAAAVEARIPRSLRRVTTQAIVGETYAFLRYQVSACAARAWLDAVGASRRDRHLTVVCTDMEDGDCAETVLRRFADQALSYVDALTLAVADRYDIGAIFAFDRQLRLTGRRLVP
jgi:predicted nucleic acid-binding protein